MSNFNEVKMANDPLKVQQPLLESSSEMNKLRFFLYQNRAFSRHQNYRDGISFPAREFRVMESLN